MSDKEVINVPDNKVDEIVCVWKMGTPCEGNRFRAKMFNNSLEIPICDRHFEEHKEVMVLVNAGHDIEQVVEMSPEERKRQYYTIKLSGVNLGEVKV